MCDERERLIGYVYDECDDDDRTLIDRHLETCATCREEIAGLRATRQDLLAWEVPDHGSVWRPFAPARFTPWYREVPAWAMAAAASLMFMIGVGGGVAGQALLRPVTVTAAPAEPPVAQVLTPSAQTSGDAAAIRAELNALETRMLAAVKASKVQFAEHVSAGSVERVSLRASTTDSDQMLTDLSRDLFRINRQLQRLEEKNTQLNASVAMLTQALAGAGVPGR